MRLTDLGEDRDKPAYPDLSAALKAYDARDKDRIALWNRAFPK